MYLEEAMDMPFVNIRSVLMPVYHHLAIRTNVMLCKTCSRNTAWNQTGGGDHWEMHIGIHHDGFQVLSTLL
jgi:hypothetical protein